MKNSRHTHRIGTAAVTAAVIPALLLAAPAHADGSGTVKARTQRMTAANLNSKQEGWYNAGDRLTLVCSTRGQNVKGFFSFNIPGGWDNLWYKTSDGHYVADVDIETGTLNAVVKDCSVAPPPAQPAPAAQPTPGRAMGKTRTTNPAYWGWCTWGAAQKWYEASGNKYFPALSGNAKAWKDSARGAGWTVVDDAQPRSIVVFQPGVQGAFGDGHVAWVNSVSRRSDGVYADVVEMNAPAGGFGKFSTRSVKDVPGMSFILMP